MKFEVKKIKAVKIFKDSPETQGIINLVKISTIILAILPRLLYVFVLFNYEILSWLGCFGQQVTEDN